MEQPASDISELEDITTVLAEHNILIEPNSFAGWSAYCESVNCLWVQTATEQEAERGQLITARAEHAAEMLASAIVQREKNAAATELRRFGEFIVRPKHPGLDRQTLHEVHSEITARADDLAREGST